ncbi:MAG TPA: type II CAAX endopeptidase family protein [Archangium sp.]|uniref:type II CAAX endopeptidase family protein n=1 Tax=Archangium sp. TaxID=1872627 RepID=UPI002ED88F46
MSSTDQPSNESEPSPSPPPFSTGVTVLCTVLLALVGIFFLSVSAQGGSPLGMLGQPMPLAARYFDRELELADASPNAVPWASLLKRLFFSPTTDLLDEAHQELRSVLEAHERGEIHGAPPEVLRIEGRLMLVLAEAGKRDLLKARLDRLAARGPDGERLAAMVRFAYGLSDERPTAGEVEAMLVLLREEGRPDPTWASDRLASRVLRRLGNEPDARAAEERILERGARALTRALWFSGGFVALMLVGLTLGALRLKSREPLPRLSSGVGPAPWSYAEGYDLTVRSGAFGLVAVLVYSTLLGVLAADAFPMGLPFTTLVGSLPMLYYLTRWVPAVHGTRLVELFGLRLEAPVTALLVATLVLIGLEQLPGMGVNLLSQQPWYEGVLEGAMFGGPLEVVMLFVDAVIWAPLFEEIACRGLLYTSLRTRFDPWKSALVSAALFTLPHMYSPLVALGLFLGAVASAVIYERTRSLLPCILAHAVNNALVFGALLVYR